MSQLDGKLHLQFELLEHRAMLAGNVQVNVVDGDLRIVGDDLGNVLELHQLSSFNPHAVSGGLSFRIAPDAGTSINRNDPGVAIVVAEITRDIGVDMGGGGDELAVFGAAGQQIRDLMIDAGSGPDAVSITRFRLAGNVKVSAVDSLDLSVVRTSAADVSVQINGSKDAVSPSVNSLSIRNSTLRGNMDIASDIPLDVQIHRTHVFPFDVCKTPAPPWPVNAPTGNVNISGVALLSVDMDQSVSTNVTVTVDDILSNPNNAAAESTNTVTIRNSTVYGDLNVSNEVPLTVEVQRTLVGPLDSCKTPAPPRPSTSQGGNVNIASSARLVAALDQTASTNVSVIIENSQGDSKDTAATSMSSVTIRSITLHGNMNLASDAQLDVKIHRTHVGPIDICKIPAPPWPVNAPSGNVNISGVAQLSVDMDQSVSTNVSVTIEDALGNPIDAVAASTSSVTFRNSRVHGDLNVFNEVPLTVSMKRTFVGPLDGCKISAPARPSIQQGGNVNISSGARLAIDIALTTATGGMFINVESVRTVGATNSISLVDSVFDSMKIIGSKWRDELEFVRMHILGRSHIETGSGNDFLKAVDSVFGGFTFLDGGDDYDSLVLKRTRFPRGSQVVNWE